MVVQRMFQRKIKKQALEDAEIVGKNLMSGQAQFFKGQNSLFQNGFMLFFASI
ncbi:MAG: hypothetical protein GDA46_02630 [Bdellovibrionales bacterium]|nr:hypothetical protein [Bdellovibrionales bacterium]